MCVLASIFNCLQFIQIIWSTFNLINKTPFWDFSFSDIVIEKQGI